MNGYCDQKRAKTNVVVSGEDIFMMCDDDV